MKILASAVILLWMVQKGRAVKKTGEKWHSLGVTEEHFQWLKEQSDKRGMSVAFILREILDNAKDTRK